MECQVPHWVGQIRVLWASWSFTSNDLRDSDCGFEFAERMPPSKDLEIYVRRTVTTYPPTPGGERKES